IEDWVSIFVKLLIKLAIPATLVLDDGLDDPGEVISPSTCESGRTQGGNVVDDCCLRRIVGTNGQVVTVGAFGRGKVNGLTIELESWLHSEPTALYSPA